MPNVLELTTTNVSATTGPSAHPPLTSSSIQKSEGTILVTLCNESMAEEDGAVEQDRLVQGKRFAREAHAANLNGVFQYLNGLGKQNVKG